MYVESLIEPLRYRQTQQYHFKLCRWREVIIVHWMCFSYRLGQDLHFQDIFPQSGGHMPLLETLVTSSGQHPVAQFMLTSWLYCSDLPEPNFSWYNIVHLLLPWFIPGLILKTSLLCDEVSWTVVLDPNFCAQILCSNFCVQTILQCLPNIF